MRKPDVLRFNDTYFTQWQVFTSTLPSSSGFLEETGIEALDGFCQIF